LRVWPPKVCGIATRHRGCRRDPGRAVDNVVRLRDSSSRPSPARRRELRDVCARTPRSRLNSPPQKTLPR
jgi:hypothetical protein